MVSTATDFDTVHDSGASSSTTLQTAFSGHMGSQEFVSNIFAWGLLNTVLVFGLATIS